MFVIAEIFRHGQCRVADPKTRAGRFVHLAEDHDHIRKNPGGFHITVEFLAFATAFANSAKNAYSVVMADHVVDHFGEQDGFAHTGAAEQPGFATAFEGQEHVDDLDAGFKNLRFGGTLGQRRRRTMHGAPLHIGRGRSAINHIAKNIEHA